MSHIPTELLASFVAVADAGSFTGAARTMGLRQSTVSQQIARLEVAAGRRLINRDTHRMSLTVDGELLLDQARLVLEAHERLERSLSATSLRGRLRIGASEDFVLSALPDVLASFARRHPEIDLELHVGLSLNLYEAFDAGRLDAILVKRKRDDERGTPAWREPIRWVAHPDFRFASGKPLPLLLYPPPSVTRSLALDTLDRAHRSWRIAFTSASLTGLTAAARAGLGMMPHSARLMPAGLVVMEPGDDLPVLPDIEFVVIAPAGNAVASALTAVVLQWAAGRKL